MSNPKLVTLSSYRSKRSEESNLVNFIDKLPHIMKEDKMLLRKKVKEGEQGVLEIFRKVNMQAYRDDEDYKRLEAVLRKYLNEFKLSAKEEQITRYKNTLKSYRSSCEKPGNKENLFNEKRGMVAEVRKVERPGPRSVKSPTSSLEKLHELKQFKNSKPVYQPQKLDTLKAKYSMEKDKHKNFTTIQLNPKAKLRSSKLLSSSSTKNLSKKQISFLDTQPIIKTETSETTLSKCHTDRYLPSSLPEVQSQFQYQPQFQPHSQPQSILRNNNPLSLAQFQNLFTPPDLLMECKLILEKAKQAPVFDVLPPSPSGPVSPRFHSANTQPTEYLLQKSKPPVQRPIGPGVSFSKELNDSNLLEVQTFKKQVEEKEPQKLDFRSKTAEQIIDIIFSQSHEITFDSFSEITNRLFSSPVELYRVFQKADILREGVVNAIDFGKCLEGVLQIEENYIRDIFELLDMERKGYIAENDITNFVHQIVDTSCENEEQVKEMFMKVIFQADLKNNGKVEYWGLHFIKSLQCFKDMVVYISQFEFEVQC